jgi:nucleoside-triphosphatase THEP1
MPNANPKPDGSFSVAAIVRRGPLDADKLLEELARKLKARGLRVGGAVRIDKPKDGTHPCDMVLEELSSGETVSLMGKHGSEAKGCRLDAAALAKIAGLVETSLDGEIDLLIVNKFGKREVEGAGLVSAITRSVESGIPVLVSISDKHAQAWHEFCGGEGRVLSADHDAVDQWLSESLPFDEALREPTALAEGV